MNSAEIAKEILVAAIEKGYFLSTSSASRTTEETNKATAEAMGEHFTTIYKAVQSAVASRSSSHL